MRAYSARLRALPGRAGHRDRARAASRRAMGIHAPRFEIERVISGSQTIITGAPFDDGADSPLWADAKAKVGKLQAAGKVTPAEAETLLAEARTSLLGVAPAYGRVIAWARANCRPRPAAASGRFPCRTARRGTPRR